MKRTLFIFSVVFATFLLVSFSVAASSPVTVSPQTAVSKGAAIAYLKQIEDIQKQAEANGIEINDKEFRGAAEDLNNDGQSELIVVYKQREGKYSFQVYTYKSGEAMLIYGKLLSTAGVNMECGIDVVNSDGENCFPIWTYWTYKSNETASSAYICRLYTIRNTDFDVKHSFYFIRNESPSGTKGMLLSDGNIITSDEYVKIKNILDNPVKRICGSGSVNSAGLGFSQLCDWLKQAAASK